MWLPKGHGNSDHIFALCVAEKAKEFNTPLCLAFVNVWKAYDSVLHRGYHLPNELIHILRVLGHSTRGAVRAYGRVLGEFDVITGVKQGDTLAPTLFNLFFDTFIATALA